MAVDPAHAKSLFLSATELASPAERAAYLDRACGDDAELRARVEALLVADAADDAAAAAADAAEPRPDPDRTGRYEAIPGAAAGASIAGGIALGRVIAGRYTLVEVLGEGGMGTVYRADQTVPVRRQVALKLIRVGMDTRGVLARFDAERQALALMDHPNIARVFDGGTTDTNQPFFVMELVHGEPITEYCDRRRLTVGARLELFVAVCLAVQHAHQKGIIHRDLKPSNVMVAEVDGRATPKVIDFGVAKATEFDLTDQSLADAGAIVGTPAYMSPEQADPSTMDVDTRTDVYALGVILYELLAGSPPLDPGRLRRGALIEMLRIVREVDPPRPSSKVSTADALPSIAAVRGIEPARLKRALQGDLDWIVMKALEKDRSRRYESANGLGLDLLRHLANEPVQAAPPGRAYRLKKFARKHRGPVIAAGLVLLALVGGIAGTTWGLIREAKRVEERDAALVLADKALKNEARRVEERDAAVNVADTRAEELKYRLGVSELVLASEAYDDGDLVQAARRLDDVPVGQRGWEWRHLKGQTRGGLFTLHGHTGLVRGAAFSPDGARIATQGEDGSVKLWDARSGILLLDLKKNSGPVIGLAFGPDGLRFVTMSDDGTAKVWDERGGTPLFELKGNYGGVFSAAFSPDGERIAATITLVHDGKVEPDGKVKLWDARSGSPLLELKGHADQIVGSSFSPDGARIAAAGLDGTTRLWDARTGSLLLELKGHTNSVMNPVFSPDGERIATAVAGRPPRVWDARTGTPLLDLKGKTVWVSCMAFSPDGARIATAGSRSSGPVSRNPNRVAKDLHEITIWDARTGASLLVLNGQTDQVWSMAFSPDGSRVVTASMDGPAKVWDAWSGSPLVQRKDPKDQVSSVAFRPDGLRVVTNGGNVWDERGGFPLLTLKGGASWVASAAFSPDGARIATANYARTARVWDARTGSPLLELKGHVSSVLNLAFSPDGSRVATASDDWTARVWDARTGSSLFQLAEHTGPVWSVAFSPDGSRVATASDDQTAIVWDARTGVLLFELKGHEDGVVGVAFSLDGSRVATASDDQTARIWDARNGSFRLELKGHTGPVTRVAFTPDGSRIATASDDQTARVWDARSGSPLLKLKGHADRVVGLAFSPDGLQISTVGFDGTTRLWDARGGSPLVVLNGHSERVLKVAFSPDGARIITVDRNRTTRLWDARTGEECNGEPIPPRTQPGPISPDGRWIARIVGDRVELIPLQPDAEEIAYRRHATQASFRRYREGYDAARSVSDDFAARFFLNLFPPPDRVRIQAEEIVKPLFARLLLREDVIAELEARPGAAPEIQSACLGLAQTLADSAYDCNEAAWPLVRDPGQPDANSRRGLRLARAACRLEPGHGPYLITLGLALYRCGLMVEALATLTRLDVRNQEDPGVLAFLALTQHHLGQFEEARATLGRLRELMEDRAGGGTPELQALLRETEVIELDRRFPADPFAR